jgi:hypothetical protein
LSYRGLSAVSNHPQTPEHAARWIPAPRAERIIDVIEGTRDDDPDTR